MKGITVILATKDRKEMADFVLEQVYNSPMPKGIPLEIIVIVKNYYDIGAKWKNLIKVIKYNFRPGGVPASEMGIEEAQGEFLTILNDDIDIKTNDWLIKAWEYREKGLVVFKDGIQNNRGTTAPFWLISTKFYMEHIYPCPYKVNGQDREVVAKCARSGYGRYYAEDIYLHHNHDPKQDDPKLIHEEQEMCAARCDEWIDNDFKQVKRNEVIIGVKTYNRPECIKKLVPNLLKTTDDVKIIISDDCSTDQNKINYLKSLDNPRIEVIFNTENKGSNGNTQRFLNLFYKNKTPKWILLDDDIIFTDVWLKTVLAIMDVKPHLVVLPRYDCPVEHAHGFFLTGTYQMLKKVGPYDLFTFPLGYGDAHADFSERCKRLNLRKAIELPLDYEHIMSTQSANKPLQRKFVAMREKYDKIVKDESRTIISWDDGDIDAIKNTNDIEVVKSKKLSIIILDWNVRESYHTLKYLNNQSIPRDQYEIIWVEFYKKKIDEEGIDKHIILGNEDSVFYHKHQMWNMGVQKSEGEIVCLADSDAIYTRDFVKTVLEFFDKNKEKSCLHFDQVRSKSEEFYPFNYPDIDDVKATSFNWKVNTTEGILDKSMPYHLKNWGACLCVKRFDYIYYGGLDEHEDYRSYFCGPYDLSFRLKNAGFKVVWHEKEFIYHTWHPLDADTKQKLPLTDGRNMAVISMDIIWHASNRLYPYVNSFNDKFHDFNSKWVKSVVVPVLNNIPWAMETLDKILGIRGVSHEPVALFLGEASLPAEWYEKVRIIHHHSPKFKGDPKERVTKELRGDTKIFLTEGEDYAN